MKKIKFLFLLPIILTMLFITACSDSNAPVVPTDLTAIYGQTIGDIELPEHWTWNDPADTPVGSAGTRFFYATYKNEQIVLLFVNVTKAVPGHKLPEGLTATYGDTLGSVVLSDGWAWDEPEKSVGDVGERAHSATFTPADTVNYDTVNKKIVVEVTPAIPVEPSPVQSTYGTTLSEVTLPSGWTWVEPNSKVGNVGIRSHEAVFDPPNENYRSAKCNVTVTVDKAVPNYELPSELTATYGDTLGSVVLPDGWVWNSPTQSLEILGRVWYSARFIPSDTENYTTVEIELTIDVSYNFAFTSIGSTHKIALDSQGRVWTWGGNNYGQLGHGGVANESKPRLLEAEGMTDIKTVGAGSSYSVAVDGQGRVWTWGYGHTGCLGHGGSGDENRPRMIEGVGGFGDIKKISASDFFIMALDGQGRIWTWGSGHTGSLGHGGTGKVYRPQLITSGNNGIKLPVFTEISGGYGLSMALDEHGNIWTWGGSANGQLGNGSPAEYTQVLRPGMLTTGYGDVKLPEFAEISAGRSHSMALDKNDRVWTWGYGLDGQLGHGVMNNELRPRMVEALSDIVKISAGTPFYPPTGKLVLDARGNSWQTDDNGNWIII